MEIINYKPNFDMDYVKKRFQQYCDILNYKMKNHQKPHNERYRQGFYLPRKPIKCLNVMETDEPQIITWRSSWELDFCKWCDDNDAIIRWGSEVIKILYRNPVKNKMCFYVPDFYIEVLNKNMKIDKYLIEVKPMCHSNLNETSNGYDRIQLAINSLKWKSAIEFCKKRDMKFKIITENDLGIKKWGQ